MRHFGIAEWNVLNQAVRENLTWFYLWYSSPEHDAKLLTDVSAWKVIVLSSILSHSFCRLSLTKQYILILQLFTLTFKVNHNLSHLQQMTKQIIRYLRIYFWNCYQMTVTLISENVEKPCSRRRRLSCIQNYKPCSCCFFCGWERLWKFVKLTEILTGGRLYKNVRTFLVKSWMNHPYIFGIVQTYT